MNKTQRKKMEKIAIAEAIGTVLYRASGRADWREINPDKAWEPFEFHSQEQLEELADGFRMQFEKMYKQGFEAGQKARKIKKEEANA